MNIEMFLWTSQRKTASGIRGKVAQVPALDKLAERRYPGMLLQCTKCRDTEPSSVLKFNDFSLGTLFFLQQRQKFPEQPLTIRQRFQVFIDLPPLCLSLPYETLTFIHHEKGERSTMFLALATLPQALTQYIGTTGGIRVDPKFVGDWPSTSLFPIIYLEFDRALDSLGMEAFKSAPTSGVTCLFDTQPETIRKESESVEKGALADASHSCQ